MTFKNNIQFHPMTSNIINAYQEHIQKTQKNIMS